MVLHTLNAGPGSTAYADCLRLLGNDDAILLTGDGVYCAAKGTRACEALVATGATLYVLCDHAEARGVLATGDAFSTVDMLRFVELTEQFPRQLAWY